MRAIKLIGLFLLLSAIAVLLWFWTPDTDYQETLEKYTAGQAEFITLKSGARIHFRDTGNKNGPTILMVHGTSDSLLTWDAISPALGDYYRLLSLDLPGHGFSDALVESSFDGFVNAAAELLHARDIESATWMGNSLGGGIAWRAALQYPKLVDRLILLDPSGAPRREAAKSNPGFKILANPIGRRIGQFITPRALIEKSLRGTVADQTLVSDALIDRYWELLRLPGNRGALANLASMPRSDDAWQKIGNITQPTLIIWGAEDTLTPTANAPVFKSAMQNADLKVYAGVGHLPMLEAPEKLADDIRAFMPRSSRRNRSRAQ